MKCYTRVTIPAFAAIMLCTAMLAKKETETYQPYLAATLNDLGILDSDQNRIERLSGNLRKR